MRAGLLAMLRNMPQLSGWPSVTGRLRRGARPLARLPAAVLDGTTLVTLTTRKLAGKTYHNFRMLSPRN